LEFLEKFERRFLSQGYYESRDIYQSLDLAWSLLRTFPRNLLTRIPNEILDEFYSRDKGIVDEEPIRDDDVPVDDDEDK